MARIRILTENERLLRTLSLLLSERHTLTEDTPTLILVDTQTVSTPPYGGAMLLLGEGALSYPLLHEALLSAVEEALRSHAAPSPALSPTETRLLEVLKAASPSPVSRETLCLAAFGKRNDGMLNLYIHYLREKLEKDGVKRIFSDRGKGYAYRADPSF